MNGEPHITSFDTAWHVMLAVGWPIIGVPA
jgi:hypothetical protein